VIAGVENRVQHLVLEQRRAVPPALPHQDVAAARPLAVPDPQALRRHAGIGVDQRLTLGHHEEPSRERRSPSDALLQLAPPSAVLG